MKSPTFKNKKGTLRVTKGKEKDCMGSLASLLLKIILWVVRYSRPDFLPETDRSEEKTRI